MVLASAANASRSSSISCSSLGTGVTDPLDHRFRGLGGHRDAKRAKARLVWVLTVPGDAPIASAVSATDSSAKNRTPKPRAGAAKAGEPRHQGEPINQPNRQDLALG